MLTIDTSETQDYKRLLWVILNQQIWQPRRNGYISRNVQPTKIELQWNKKLIWSITIKKISIQNLPMNKIPGLDGFPEFYYTLSHYF